MWGDVVKFRIAYKKHYLLQSRLKCGLKASIVLSHAVGEHHLNPLCFIRKELGDKFEIVFCSGDRDDESLKEYYKHMKDEGGPLVAWEKIGRIGRTPRFHAFIRDRRRKN